MNNLFAKPLERIALNDFTGKFSAWWDGVDYVVPQPEPVEEGGQDAQSADNPFEDVSESMVAMAFAQGLWGEGYLGPGKANHYTDLVKNMSLSNEKNLGVLGLGLAGAVRDIVRETDVWVTGYESRKIAVNESNRQCTNSGMAKKITIHAYDPGTIELPENKFNGIVSFEEFLFVENKSRLIEQVAASLKHSGSFLLTDYVALKGDPDKDRLATMFPTLWGGASLWKVEQYVAAIEEAGLKSRVSEDITTHYVKMIEEGWAGWRKLFNTLKSKDMSSAQEAAVFRMVGEQAAVWANRLDAMNAGEIGVYRLLALKPSAPVR